MNKMSARKTLQLTLKNGVVKEMESRDREDIAELAEGKFVVLIFHNVKMYQGYFIGLDGCDIMLKTMDSKLTFPFPFNALASYYQEKN